MTSWGWPQYAMAALYALTPITKFYLYVKDPKISSGRATLNLFAWTGLLTWVLYQGGFRW